MMKQIQKKKRLDDLALSAFCGQMALVLKAGISSLEGISIMKDDADNDSDRALLTEIETQFESLGELSQALLAVQVFPDYLCRMVEIGERTGSLDSVMEALEIHYDREDAINKAVNSAIVYPLVLSAMMIIVILILLIRVMPVFQQVFQELGTAMTGLPLTLMNLGAVIRNYTISFLLILFSMILVGVVLNRTEQGRAFSRRFGNHIPSIRASNHAVAACRFASNMALALSSGLVPEEGLELAAKANEDERFGEELSACRQELYDGEDFGDVLYRHHIFSGIYARMLQIGSKTGSFDQVMRKIADMYQAEIDARLNNRLAILEPALVIALCVAVGAILLSVMFPLLGIMGSL